MEHVRVDEADGVAVVTLVDRERRNAMTAPMVAEIVETFDALEADETIGAVVITGEPPAFCTGADVVAASARSPARTTDGERRSVASIYEGFLRVLRSPLPTVAAVNGPAVGAGMNLALACDVRIAGDVGALRRPVPADRPAPRRRPHVDARTGRRPAGRRRDRAVRRARRRRPRGRDRPRVELPPRRRAPRPPRARSRRARRHGPEGAVGARRSRRCAQVPWQPDFDAALATEVEHQAWSLGQGWFNAPR